VPESALRSTYIVHCLDANTFVSVDTNLDLCLDLLKLAYRIHVDRLSCSWGWGVLISKC